MIRKQYAVFGLGKFGGSVAKALASSGCEVLAVDKDEELVEELADDVSCAVCADITNPKAIKSLGLHNIDVAVIGLAEDMETSILATILVKEEGVPYIVAKAVSGLHEMILKKVGADKVIFPEQDSGIRVARNLISGSFEDLFSLSDTFSIVEMKVPHQWSGRSLRELCLRDKYKINVAAVKTENEVRVDFHPDEILRQEMLLVLIGNNSDLEKMKEKLKK